jgi:carboxyl-terminal processing protease
MKKLIGLFACFVGMMSYSYADISVSSESFGGIGIEIRIEDGAISVGADLPNSPAEKAGLAAGDLIEAVQPSPDRAFVPVEGKTLLEVVDLIRGPVGTPVGIKVMRCSSEQSFSIVREVIQINKEGV